MLWASIGLLFFAFILRHANTLVLPLFVDEATHIFYAQFQILEPNPFFGAQNNKWLYLVTLRLFNPLGPEAPWLGRTISALVSLITVACAIVVGRLLDRPVTGLVAGLLYAVLPLAVWHERQALVDPMLATMTALVTVLSLRLALKPRIWMAALLSVTLCGALIAKLAAVPFLAFPVAATLLLMDRNKNWRKSLGFAAVATIVSMPLYQGYERIRTSYGYGSLDTHGASTDNILLFDLANPKARTTLARNFSDYLDTMWVYVGPALLVVIIGSLLWAALNKRRWEILLLWIPALAFTILPIIAVPVTGSGWNPPRYYLMQALPMMVLAAISLRLLNEALPSSWRYSAIAIGGLLVFLALVDDIIYITDPLQANLTEVDQDNYWAFSSGYGRIDAIEAVLDLHQQDPMTRFNIIGRGYDMIWFRGYMGPDIGSFETLEQDGDEQEDAQQGRVARWLTQGERVFYVEEVDRSPVEATPHGADITLIGNYPYRERTYRVYEAVGATEPLAEEIFLILGRDPQFMGDDYDALASHLDNLNATDVIIFPPTHTDMLAERTTADIKSLPILTWPYDQAVANSAVETATNPTSGQIIDVILSNQEEADAQRHVQLALVDQLYPLGETTFFGLLAHQRYVAGLSNPDMSPIGAEFEGVITLEAGGQVGQTQACCTQLFAFNWQTSEPVQDSFIVFTHIVDEQGNLVAQRDSIPGNGLLPLNSWAVGEIITDQFAITPVDALVQGRYQVRVGLYEPNSGLRLRVTSASGDEPADYVVVGEFSIR